MDKTTLRLKLREAARMVRAMKGDYVRPGQEAVYQGLFRRDLASVGLEDIYYPVGFAASYSLLYLILRALREYPVTSIVELGAGQSSLLLDALKKAGITQATITTVEHDHHWAERVQKQVAHRVIAADLIPVDVAGQQIRSYDLSALEPAPISMLMIDGPVAGTARNRYSRLGAVRLADRLDPAGFIVIVDDAERRGEAFLGDHLRQALTQRGVPFTVGNVLAAKRQIVLAGGAFVGAAYY